MPCYDGRDQEDAIAAARRHDAMTAMLCGVMNTEKRALQLAVEWCSHHALADKLRKGVKYDWQDTRIGEALRKCDEVCDRAHAELCTAHQE